MRQTTRDIKSTVVEKSSSRVYCRSAFVSNSSSRVARLSANCMVPRAMMEIGLSWTKRSKIVPSIIGFASVLFPDCHEGENLPRTPEGNTFKGLDSNPVRQAWNPIPRRQPQECQECQPWAWNELHTGP